jgi:hypothetical protein
MFSSSFPSWYCFINVHFSFFFIEYRESCDLWNMRKTYLSFMDSRSLCQPSGNNINAIYGVCVLMIQLPISQKLNREKRTIFVNIAGVPSHPQTYWNRTSITNTTIS